MGSDPGLTAEMAYTVPKTSGATLEVYPGRAEWLAARALGGSDIAAIVGASKWDSQLSLWCKKLGIIVTKDNAAMERGRDLEPVVLKKYNRRFEVTVWHVENSLFRAKRSKQYHASVDALNIEAKTVLNAKTARWKKDEWGEDMTDVIPAGYIVSAQWEMGILGREWKMHHIPTLFSGEDFYTYAIQRDDELIRHLFAEARKFLRYVDSKTAPPVDDGLEETRRALLNMYPEPVGEILDANKKITAVIEDRERMIAELEKLKKDKQEADNMLMEAIGENLGVTTGNITMKWGSRAKAGKFDREAFKEAHPAIYEKFYTPGGTTRALTRKEHK